MARPKKIIDYELVEKLANIQCTMVEIANVLEVSLSRLEKDKEFIRVYKKGMEKGKMSLRRKQWKAVEDGSVTMMIWLGKQYLGQVEDRENNNIKKEHLEISKKELEFKLAQAEKGLTAEGEDILMAMINSLKKMQEENEYNTRCVP